MHAVAVELDLVQPLGSVRRRVDELGQPRPDPFRQRGQVRSARCRSRHLRHRLREEAERRQRRRAGAVLVWNDRKTEMARLDAVKVLFFTLVGGAVRAEGIVLSEDLPIWPPSSETSARTCWVRSRISSSTSYASSRDRLRLIKFDDNALDGVEARADPARGSRAAASVQHMLDRMSRIFGRVSDRRAADDVDLAVGSCAGGRIRVKRSLTNARGFPHSRMWGFVRTSVGLTCLDRGKRALASSPSGPFRKNSP